uniref:Uncharacterized protein n=1 Tax=Anguilla anguilla TaxID=7936 RepID=A0A0E9QNH5_ANGAN
MITQNLSHLPRSFDISRKKLLLANMSTTSPTNIVLMTYNDDDLSLDTRLGFKNATPGLAISLRFTKTQN